MYVYGKATGDDLDLDEQIIDKDFARAALGEWFKGFSNVRQMHSTHLPPAGKGVELTEEEDGFWLKSRVVEPGAMKLAEEGVYSAYSVGISKPRIVRDAGAANGRIVGGVISEVSLVDYPANPTCKAMVVKMAEDGVLEEQGGTETLRTAMVDAEPEPVETEPEPEETDKAGVPDIAKAVAQADQARATIADIAATATDAREAANVLKTLGVEIAKADPDLSDDAREQAAKDGKAMPDGSYPTRTKSEFEDAVKAYGRAKDKPAVKAYLEKRAKEEGWEDALPEKWDDDAKKGRPLDTLPTLLKAVHDAACPACTHSAALEANPLLQKGAAMTLGPQVKQLFWQMLSECVAEDGGQGSDCWAISSIARAYCDLCCSIDCLVSNEMWDAIDGGEVILAAAHAELRKAAGTSDADDDAALKEAGSRSYYTNAARDSATAAMRAMHDSLASLWPEVCEAGHHGDAGPDPAVGTVEVAAIEVDAPAEAVIETGISPEQYVNAGLQPDIAKSITDKFDALEAKLAERDEKIGELTELVEKLAAAPSAAEAPVRGRVTMVDTPELAPEEPQGGQETREQYLKSMAASVDPAIRLAAESELAKIAAGS